MRYHHYSAQTERLRYDRIKKFLEFHGMGFHTTLKNGGKKIEALVTHPAVSKNMAPSVQNQAMNALVFYIKKFLNNPPGVLNAILFRGV
jgi:hypothetical protein